MRAPTQIALLLLCAAGCTPKPAGPSFDFSGPADMTRLYDFAQPDEAPLPDLGARDLATRDLAAPDLSSTGGDGGADLEVNYCIVQFPSTASAMAGQASPPIYGQIYQAGLTDANNTPAPGILSALGVGPMGTDARSAAGWSWTAAVPNAGYDFSKNNDEYQATLTVAQAGSYSYVYRFSVTNGSGWTYCDTIGNGSNNGLPPFDPAKAGVLTVN
jgi:hypothetical protein